jgi:hypothetical protein
MGVSGPIFSSAARFEVIGMFDRGRLSDDEVVERASGGAEEAKGFSSNEGILV